MLRLEQLPDSKDQLIQGTLYTSLIKWAAEQPEATFLIEAETGRTLSYGQALTAVNNMRQFLGNTPHHIILALPGSIINAVLWLSALSGGHHLIPASPQATDSEKAAIASRHQPDVLCVEQQQDAVGFNCPQAQVLTRDVCEMLLAEPSTQTLMEPLEGCVYLGTSGTTGEPKSVILAERQVAWTADSVCSSHGLSAQDRGLTVLPFFHVNAPVVSLCASLLVGSSVVIARRFSKSHFWEWVERYQVTWASIVPAIVAILLETRRPAFLPGSLRYVRTGSAPLPPADLDAFETRFGIPVIETYGLSEAASQIVANPVPPGTHKPGSAGLPVGVALRICALRTAENQALCGVAPGESGEICVAGPSLIQSYQHDRGKESFQDGWFRTGDLGYLDEDGYLFIKGRLREVINRGGENIAPREVEEVILNYPAVREAAAVGRPDPIYGEQVVAYLTVREDWHEESAQQLRDHLTRHLSAQKIPVDFIVLEELPKNATGKIERRLLRAREQAHYGQR